MRGAPSVATMEECRAALDQLAERLGGGGQRSVDFDRSLSCRLDDLDATFSGRLRGGQLEDITTEERPKAQIRLTTSSDDLVALTLGKLNFASAWAAGRLKVEASVLDLVKLRGML